MQIYYERLMLIIHYQFTISKEIDSKYKVQSVVHKLFHQGLF